MRAYFLSWHSVTPSRIRRVSNFNVFNSLAMRNTCTRVQRDVNEVRRARSMIVPFCELSWWCGDYSRSHFIAPFTSRGWGRACCNGWRRCISNQRGDNVRNYRTGRRGRSPWRTMTRIFSFLYLVVALSVRYGPRRGDRGDVDFSYGRKGGSIGRSIIWSN